MAQTDEARLLGAFAGGLTAQDHDQRIDVLLSSGDRISATRMRLRPWRVRNTTLC